METTKDFNELLQATVTRAHSMSHEFYTPEHFLYEALKSDKYKDFFDSLSFDKNKSIKLLEKYFTDKLDKMNNLNYTPEASVAFNKCIDDAVENSKNNGKEALDVYDMFEAIVQNDDTYAYAALSIAGLDDDQFFEKIDELNMSFEDDSSDEEDEYTDEDEDDSVNPLGQFVMHVMGSPMPQQKKTKKDPHPALTKFSINLTKEAKDGKLMPIIGRDNELESTIQTLCRKTKNNPVYVGDPGVGKTAIIEALAQRIASGNVPDAIKDAPIYSIEMGSLVAGTQYRGQFEARIKAIVDEAKKINKCILFIDEIHTVVGAGSGSSGSLDASNILKPALARGQIKCIGATTYDEYKKVFEKDKALARRFQKIDVAEPSREDTIEIIKGIAPKYEAFHGITYDEDALIAAIDLSVKYINDRKLPDKAIDIIDEAGSYAKIHKAPIVGIDIIKKVTSKISKVPIETMTQSDSDKLKELDKVVKNQIFGQDKAVDQIIKSIKKSKAGFKNPEKPEACYLFVGPTGVGKTELCKVLSKELNEKLIRFDMSEYQEAYTVSKLIGSSAGYVGYEEGGLLTEAVRKDPHSIILFDEIEKANSAVFNLMLQIMDYGTLTDNQGRKVDFRNTIIIMTSNVGATAAAEHKSIGFGTEVDDASMEIYEAELKKTFTPEFRNRLDGVIMFNQLDETIAKNIAENEIKKIAKRLEAKNIILTATKKAIDYIASKGYSKEFGGRNIAKTAENLIAEPLIDDILFGNLQNGGAIEADCNNDKIIFNNGKKVKQAKSLKKEKELA